VKPGYWPEDTSVRTHTMRAYLGGSGTVTPLDQIHVTSELAGDLPGQLVGGGGLAPSTGEIAWSQPAPVATLAPQPWFRGGAVLPPAAGTSLVVDVGDGRGQWWRRLTGCIDSSSGSIISGSVASPIIDGIDKLNAVVNHVPLLPSMPPVADGGAYRIVGLTGPWITDMLARVGGFCATPPAVASTIFSATLLGSLWPEIGVSERADSWTGAVPGPQWVTTSWGLAAHDIDATYATVSAWSAVELTMCLTTPPAGSLAMTAAVIDDAGVGVWLAHQTGGDVITAGIRNPGTVTLLTIPRSGTDRVAVGFSVTGGVASLIVQTRDGRQFTATSNDAAFASAWACTTVAIQGDAAVGGVTVDANAVGTWRALGFQSTARLRVSALQYLDAMPALAEKTAMALLAEQAAAECATLWVDVYGVLQWASCGVLEVGAAVLTKSTSFTVDDLGWEDNIEALRSSVTIQYRQAAVSVHNFDSVLLWQGTGESLQNLQTSEVWVKPDTDVDWILPDMPGTFLTSVVASSLLSRGSWFGAALAGDSDTDVQTYANGVQVTIVPSTVTDNTYRVVTTAAAVPAGLTALLRTPDAAVNLPRWWRGVDLPMVRGKARIDWTDQSVIRSTGATGFIPELIHDAGWWVQNATRLDELLTWLVDHTATTQPTVRSVVIDPDPRLEIGDKLRIEDPYRTGLRLDLILTGIDDTWDGGAAPSMTCNGRVVAATQPFIVAEPVPL